MDRTTKGIQNFLKVAGIAVTQPQKLAVLGIGIGVSTFFPAVAIPMVLLSFAAVAGMTWTDINDETFMKAVLSNRNISSKDPIKDAYASIEFVARTKNLFPEVKEDLVCALDVINRIRDLLNTLPEEDRGFLTFSEDYIGKLSNRLISLSALEQRARQYLSHGDSAKLEKEIKKVTLEVKNAEDLIAKQEYEKTLLLLKDQKELSQNLKKRLQRIESYILRINTTFENTYAQMNKILLKDEASFVDEGEILNESLKKMVSDIDQFEKQTVDIATSLEEQEKIPQKQAIRH